MIVFYARSILKCVVFTGILVWIIYKIVSGRPVLSPSSARGSVKVWYEQHLRAVDMSLKVLIAPVAVFCFIYFVVPFSLDIPDIINDNFQQVSGTVLTKAYSSRDSERLIRIADEKTGEEISVSVFYDRADKGDYIEVKYLKHSKSGVVVKHVKKKG